MLIPAEGGTGFQPVGPGEAWQLRQLPYGEVVRVLSTHAGRGRPDRSRTAL